MSISQKLNLKVAQTQTLTPQMAQSLKLLELSNIDLNQELQDLATDNPLLSVEQPEYEGSESLASAPDMDNLSFENTWSGKSSQAFSDQQQDQFERIADDDISLRDHLTSQINMDFEEAADRFIALSLVDQLDEAGYLRADLHKVAQKLRVDYPKLQEIHTRLKELAPAGIFATDLQECLSLQLKDRNLWDEQTELFLRSLDLLAQGHFEKLKKKCGLEDDELTEKIKLIRELDPKPGFAFAHESNTTIVPDILLKRNQEGDGWYVVLNPRTLPKVLIDHQYFSEVKDETQDKKALKYIKDNYNAANWLEKALQQRCDTMLKVATEIVGLQTLFFERGVSALKPLKLADIAQEIEMHESTISRTVNNKFMSTPLGTFELKYFFTTALTSAYGEKDLSAESVRSRIKALVDKEDKNKPISDDKLVDILKGEGMTVARRTVAKYRDALGIPSSFYRKGWKQVV